MAKKEIKRSNWVSNFYIVGAAKVSDFTFKTNQQSAKSDWIYNQMALYVDAGDKSGSIRCDMMGGYGANRENVIYAHGKDEKGKDDFSNRITIDWDDRFEEDVIAEVGDMCFITVGVERDIKGSAFKKQFLSEYDAINYLSEHLTDGMIVSVSGNLRYSTYNDVTKVQKNIKSIVLYDKADNREKYHATFTQSVLLDQDSVNMKEIDKKTGRVEINARVLDYVKEINGVEIKGQYPLAYKFEYVFKDMANGALNKKIYETIFKVKKDITQVNFRGTLVEGGATVTTTIDDIPDEIKELIDIGVYTEEEALAACSTNGRREQRMVIERPCIKTPSEEEAANGARPTRLMFPEMYTEDELDFSFVYENESEEESENVESVESDDSGLDWLNDL